jgi:polyhydroxyalkanoate synthesis regulator protein
VDHQSGADLTAATLLQVILDLEKRIGDYVPNSFLARIIQTSDAAQFRFFKKRLVKKIRFP